MILGNIKFQWVGQVIPPAGWRLSSQRHPCHELILVARGWLNVESGGRRFTVAPGEAMIYPAGVVHTEWADPDEPLEIMYIPFDAAHLPYKVVTKGWDRHGHMLHAMRWLYADRDSRDPASRDQRHAIVQAVIAEFMKPIEPKDGGMTARIRSYMRSRIEEAISLGELAAHAKMSKFHFLRTYRKFAGRTPMADLRALRADYARELLVSTATPIKEIAEMAGLGSPYAMSRLFSSLYGMPPGRFRK